jgi:hypothetical protein
LLKKHGKVVLVRIPVSEEILKIENKLCISFDSIIESRFVDVPYLNYKNEAKKYMYIDGVHLYKKSGKEFTKQLANDINSLRLIKEKQD